MARAIENSIRKYGLLLAFLATLLFPQAAQARGEWYRGLDLENSVASSYLILVVRVAEVSESKTVSGGKSEITTQQIKFQPVRTLKGVFTRDELQLTTSDLGGFDEPTTLERGQLRLLILGRSGQGYANYNRQDTLDRSVPSLQGENDPLLGAVKVLIGLSQQRDRGKKVALLLDGLRDVKGAGAVPLLLALQRRALVAAQTAGAPAAVARLLADDSAAVREAAVGALHALLEADYLEQKELGEIAAAALAALLDKPDVELALRVVALDALGAAGAPALANPAAAAQLKLDKPRDTFAERAAVVRAIGRLKLKNQRDAVAALLEGLPLDAPHELQAAAVTTLTQLDAEAAAKLIAQRLKKKMTLGLTVEVEIGQIAELPPAIAAPALLDVLKSNLNHSEKIAFTQAAAHVGLVSPMEFR